MATALRLVITNLHKQSPRFRFLHLPAFSVKSCPCGLAISERTKYSGPKSYSKSKQRFAQRTKIRSLSLEEDLFAEDTVLEEAEDHMLEHAMGENASHSNRQLKKERLRVKLAIIRRKYFRPEQETSLLTWEAKEQIRFLHQKMPDIWTVKKLAESYPCSETGIEKVLSSSYQPSSDVEKEKYNRRTRQHWVALLSALKNKVHSQDPAVLHLVEEKKLPLMLNASGIKDLPTFTHGKSKGGKSKVKPKGVGLFESVIKSYNDKIQVKRTPASEHPALADRSDNQLLLSIAQMEQATGHLSPGSDSVLENISLKSSEENDFNITQARASIKAPKRNNYNRRGEKQTFDLKYNYINK